MGWKRVLPNVGCAVVQFKPAQLQLMVLGIVSRAEFEFTKMPA
jgi:hypothetical protein